MDVGAVAGKSFESGYCHIFDKTDLASDVKTDDRGIHLRIAHPRQTHDASGLDKAKTNWSIVFRSIVRVVDSTV